ncbi:MAG TPA: flagellar motor switch protein FliM [Vicinamibacterales bacterium]|jgi:flagellar motor switch protein FliM
MSRILSQEEIDALIASSPADGSTGRADAGPPVTTFNFRRPDRVSKDQIRSLHFIHDRFARNATTSLAAFLRTSIELSVVSVEQFSYSEFLMALPDPTAFYAIAMPPADALGAIELNPAVAFAMIDRILGGTGESGAPQRALTEIEQNVVDSVIKLLLDHLTETWRPVSEIRFRIHARETRPQMLQVASWNEVVVLLAFDLKVGETRGLLNLCVPASVIEATGAGFSQGWQQTRREPTAQEQEWLTENLGLVRLAVTTDVQTRLTTRELIQLQPGHVLSLGVPAETEVNVRVGNIIKFRGRLATASGRAAVRVNRSCAVSSGIWEEGQ